MPRTIVRKTKMVVTSPSDRNQTVRLPYAVAWAAARGIARDTHYAVVLYGEFGVARFNDTGGGMVEWIRSGIVSGFNSQTTLAI